MFIAVVVVGQGVGQASLWSGVVAALAAVMAAVAAVWPLVARPPAGLVPPELEVPAWVVGRPVEAGLAVTALLRGGDGLVGLTTGLYGAGGFGKTTLARVVCADARVRRRFRGGVFLVTVGRDVRGAAAVAAKVNDVIKVVSGEDATFTDPELAGTRLGALLDAGPRRLLVIDDVWEAGQLAPFAAAGARCSRLVTTRVPGLLGGRDVAVRVDQMSAAQARLVLAAGLPPFSPAVAEGLLAVTGRWALLLRLINKILLNAVASGADPDAIGSRLLERLHAEGPAVVDDVLGDSVGALDVGEPGERAQAVRATIEASTSLLGPPDRQRFAELAVFAEDETVPFALFSLLWKETAGLDGLQSSQLCARLGQLALVEVSPGRADAGGVALHDVVRDYLRGELGAQRISELNEVLLRVAAEDRPGDDVTGDRVPWWELRLDGRYLQHHLIRHLVEAGRNGEAADVACDLRWAEFRLRQSGPAAVASDLALAGTPKAARMRAALARVAHLLGPTDPPDAVISVLHSRLADDPDWGPQVATGQKTARRPRLLARWPLPDLPDPALRRVLTGHDGQVEGAVIAPDGSWLATGGSDGTVRIWDPATGQQQAVFRGHRGRVYTVAAAPDGSWLAAGGAGDNRVLIWDVATGAVRATLASREVKAIAVAPDGSWLAVGNLDHRVRIFDITTGKQRRKLGGGSGWTTAVVIARDGSWLATSGYDHTVRIWDAAAGTLRATFGTGTGWVTAMALAPDGSWLAGGCSDGTVRIWDTTTGTERLVLMWHSAGLVTALAVAPDGSWVVGGASNGTLRIWETATWEQAASIPSPGAQVAVVTVAPDGTWMAAGYNDGTTRIWDPAAERPRTARAGYRHWVDTVAALPDGSGLVTGGPDPRVRIWDTSTGSERIRLVGHSAPVAAVTVAPDGTWIATSGGDPDVLVWDTAAASGLAALPGHGGWTAALSVAPDSTWLATSGHLGAVAVRDAATGEHRAVFGVHRVGGRELGTAAAENWAAFQASDTLSNIRMRDAATRKGRVLLTLRESCVYAVAVSPDGTWLAAAGLDPVVRVWDMATAKLRFTLTGHQACVYAATAGPDSSWLATGSADGTVRIWDMTTGKQQAVLNSHQGNVYTVAVAPDNPWLATAGADRTVRIWNTASWQAWTLMRVEDTIYSCAWLHGGGLACGGPAGLYMFDFQAGTASSAS